MAKEIDLTKPLSEFDLRYLVDRNRWADIRQNADNLGIPAPNLPSARGIRAQTPRVALRKANDPFNKIAEMMGVTVVDEDTDEPTVASEQTNETRVVDYGKLTVLQLKEELDKRRADYEKAGDADAVAEVSYTNDDRKEALVQKLKDDDAAQVADDEDSDEE